MCSFGSDWAILDHKEMTQIQKIEATDLIGQEGLCQEK